MLNSRDRLPNRKAKRPALNSLHFGLAAAAMATMLIGSSALATPPSISAPADTSSTQPGQPGQTSASTGFLIGLEHRSYLLGDLWGLRKELSKYGITLNISETSELLGNVTGGVQKGFEYDGLTQVDAQLDTQRAWRHYGGTFNVSALQIHGNNLSSSNLYTLQTASGIEADRSTRLWELWYQQKFLEEDRLDIKIGQQSLDQEFMVSQNAGVFVNTMFGWAMTPSADLPGGGPAYPLSALGVRFRARPTNALTVLAGVFNGSPASNNNGDPQRQDYTGTSFPLNGGALLITELQYAYPALGSMVYAGQSAPMSRLYKVGAYYDTESFADEEFDDTGRSLADPASDGTPQRHRGNYGLYAVADQMVWQSSIDPDKTMSVFFRGMTQPQSDRNLINYSLNAGFVLRDPFPKLQRDEDTFGVGLGYAKVSNGAASLDRDTGYFSNAPYPVRSSETFVEATYQYQLTPWCQLQPDFQYVFNPGGGLLNPNAPGQKIGDEAVIGTRVNILF